MTSRYIHNEIVHNLEAPKQMVPIIMNLFNPHSVIDVGCGLGTFLHVFQEYGVKEIHGIDGPWVNKDLLSKYISLNDFEEIDLEKPYNSKKKFDLAICLEVAEHLSPESSTTIIETLTNLSDIIIFSAAIPKQGGMNHINEQWQSYWHDIFKKFGYEALDIIRPQIWDNKNIFFWYKQNTFCYYKQGCTFSSTKINTSLGSIFNLVHPEMYDIKCKQIENNINELENLRKGMYSPKVYLWMLKNCLKRIMKL